MAVITISRETGSGGSDIGRAVAERLKYHLADKETLGRILSQYGFVEFRETYDTMPSIWSRFDRNAATIVSMLGTATIALAGHGNIVIIGRGSHATLAGYPDVLRVRIQAPFHYRAMNFMQRNHILDIQWAEDTVKDTDRVRSSFVESYYNVKWDSAKAYDLVIDTSKIAEEMAVAWIVQAAGAISARAGENEARVASEDIDPVMKAAVNEILGCELRH